VIKSYNTSKRDALFLNCILTKNCTCFGQIDCPSFAVLLLYSQQYVFCHTGYVDCQLADSQFGRVAAYVAAYAATRPN